MKELSRVDIFLIAFAVIVMIVIYFIYPHTYLAKQVYEEQVQNAMTYINAVQYDRDEGYQKEIRRLIKKYHLEDIYGDTNNPIEKMLNENR